MAAWLAAVALGARGHYAAAATHLGPLARSPDPVLAALAAATRASHLRQVGGHAAARSWDARGLHRLTAARAADAGPDGAPGLAAAARAEARLALAADARAEVPLDLAADAPADVQLGLAADGRREVPLDLAADAPVDVRLGLAADARRKEPLGLAADGQRDVPLDPAADVWRDVPLGLAAGGRSDVQLGLAADARSDVLLGLAADAVGLGRVGEARRLVALDTGDVSPRCRVRRSWLRAEIELAAGNAPAAIAPARAALGIEFGSIRHRVKSAIVLGAALAATGERDEAEELLVGNLRIAADRGLRPLVWPAALVLDQLGHTERKEQAVDALRCVLRHSDPIARCHAEASPWVPTWLFASAPNR
ncbi:hypothetical protein [Actinokineospora sp. UTMC 2448]|uniref:hypothetical protein n=1 Tax=Actinokineospora sp. UTMC 2448 TaxID=2268449 RepID=UPI002164A431|nr:hypothetical protein [Actinokineospora sp. UTMC 2448]UVS82094.1 hypothetical protein Actkin_05859 [Actinokineospora sp. UTMC 2448]